MISQITTGVASCGLALMLVGGAAGQHQPDERTPAAEPQPESRGFFGTFWRAYANELVPPPAANDTEPARRALPAPLDSPPFPSSEWQGFPLLGVPYSTTEYPLTKALYTLPGIGNFLKEERIKVYGWINASGNWSSADNSNIPTSYWIFPNEPVLNQAILRFEREADTVQTDHIDWGFRSTWLYGTDYRFMASGGWFSDQLLEHNKKYGFDPTEQYLNVYVPRIAQGMLVTVGRWIATPDIETQFAPDNYLGTHSILFTYDTYTQTGVMATLMLTKQWTIQGAVHAGHDNFNYLVGTWQHRFNPAWHTKTEAYFMWQRDAVLGGTPSIGPVRSFGGGGGIGADIPGLSKAYGVLNYTMWALSKGDFFTFRNEWWRDEQGMRTGFATNYSSHTLGFTHQFNNVLEIRPEVGYYHSYDAKAFDLGKKDHLWMGGLDVIFRF